MRRSFVFRESDIMDIFGAIIFWLFIAGLAIVGLAGIVMCGTGIKNLSTKERSSTDILLIIFGLLITAAMIALIVFLIILNAELTAEMRLDPMYGFTV
jgi:hypothetical protein